MGNQCPYAAPHNAYRCQGEDRWCVIAVFTDQEWRSLCQVLGNPLWSRESRFATLLGRKQHEAELDRLIEEWTVSRTAEEVMSLLQGAGIAAGVVETGEDLLDHDPQLEHRQTFVELDHPEVGIYRSQAGPHFLLSKTHFEVQRAPLLGEHNKYVFQGILGLSEAEFGRLVQEGIIN